LRIVVAKAIDPQVGERLAVLAASARRTDEPVAGAGGVRPQLRIDVPVEKRKDGKPPVQRLATVKDLPVNPVDGLGDKPSAQEVLTFIKQLSLSANDADFKAVCNAVLARIDHLDAHLGGQLDYRRKIEGRFHLLKVQMRLLSELSDKVAVSGEGCSNAKKQSVALKMFDDIARRGRHVDVDLRELQQLKIAEPEAKQERVVARKFFP